MKLDTRKTVTAAILAVVVCVATLMIQIPSPLKGYIHLGDAAVLASGWLLAPPYGVLAAGMGAMLADVLTGYMTYAPATFIIKAAMAWLAWQGFRLLRKRLGETSARILSALTAQLMMILGYFAYEAALYGLSLSAMNIPMNAVQAAAGVFVGTLLMHFLDRNRFFRRTRK